MYKKYFQDKTVLLLSGVSAFLAAFTTLFVILKVDSSKTSAIIIYRPVLGLQGSFVQGSNFELYTFSIVAPLLVLGGSFLAKRLYDINRSYGLVALALILVFLIFNLRVAMALIAIR